MINYFNINVNDIYWIDIVVGGDHIQGVFFPPTRSIYAMDDEETIEHKAHIVCIRYRKNNGTIL